MGIIIHFKKLNYLKFRLCLVITQRDKIKKYHFFASASDFKNSFFVTMKCTHILKTKLLF